MSHNTSERLIAFETLIGAECNAYKSGKLFLIVREDTCEMLGSSFDSYADALTDALISYRNLVRFDHMCYYPAASALN